MAHTSTGKITAPVNTRADVKAVLGESTDVIRLLCTSSKVNKWSKRKPIQIASAAPDRSKAWYRGADNKCGLSYSVFTNVNDLINNWADHWVRTNVPTSNYRLADFNGYNHTVIPVVSFSVTDVTRSNSGEYLVAPYFQIIMSYSDDCVQLSEIAYSSTQNLDKWYFGVITCREDLTGKVLITSGVDFSSVSTQGSNYGNYQRYATTSTLLYSYEGNYRAYPILCNTPNLARSIDVSIASYKFIPLPIAYKPFKVTLTSSVYKISGTNTKNVASGSGTGLTYNSTFSVTLTNNSGSSISGYNSSLTYKLQLVYDENGTWKEWNDSSVNITSWSVAARSSSTYTFTRNAVPTYFNGYKVMRAFIVITWNAATGVTLNSQAIPITAI